MVFRGIIIFSLTGEIIGHQLLTLIQFNLRGLHPVIFFLSQKTVIIVYVLFEVDKKQIELVIFLWMMKMG